MKAKRYEARQFILDNLETESIHCIYWPFYITRKGYGDVKFPNINGLAHNVMCKLAHGDPNFGEEASHSCGNKHCINPKHLSWKTHKDNILDKEHQGKQPKGEEIHLSVLTENDVIEIRKSNLPQKNIAKLFGISPSNVSYIRSRKTWKHI